MKEIIARIKQATGCGHQPGEEKPAPDGHCYLALMCSDLLAAITELKRCPDVTLVDLWAAENFYGPGFTLFYAFAIRSVSELLILRVDLNGKQGPSVAASYPLATYLERVVTDGFGIEFAGAFDQRRLFLHEAYPDGFHPLLKSFRNGPIRVKESVSPAAEYAFKPVTGEGIYQIPVGPVHAGIIESGHFRFSVIGETILNLEIRHFYKHRGLEKLAEGMTPSAAMRVAETVSGDEGAANACALAMALERIAGVEAPPRAWQLRTLLLEMERVYCHLGDLAGMNVDVAFPVGAMPFFNLREEILRWNAAITGSRFLKGAIIPGGVKRDPDTPTLGKLQTCVGEFIPRLDRALADTYAVPWVIDRFETTGVVKKELSQPLNLSGPLARASGNGCDTRADHPYGLYKRLNPAVKTRETGDVLARFQLKADEIKESIRLAADILKSLEDGPIAVPCPSREGYALTMVEAARGQNLCWVNIKNGTIDRYHVRTASFCNWLAIEHAVIGNIVPDFPLINKSLNLSYAGNDL